MDPSRHMRWIKPPIFLLCLAPLAALGYKAYSGNLGANPIELITHSTGTWTLVFLLRDALASDDSDSQGTAPELGDSLPPHVRPLRVFLPGCLHFTTYIWLDQFFDVHSMIKDVYKRPFITVGFAAFTLMWPLALTSTKGMIRRLGGKRWQLLHRLIYVSAILGVIHYYWLVKIDETVPYRFAVVVAVLLGYRLVVYFFDKRNKPSSAGKAAHAPVKTAPAIS